VTEHPERRYRVLTIEEAAMALWMLRHQPQTPRRASGAAPKDEISMTQTTPQLPLLYRSMIAELYGAGGSGSLDIHGRVSVASDRRGPQRNLNGNPTDWLRIVSLGLLAGEAGKLVLTDAGRAEAERIIAERTSRTAA
jgi:hypothetical protein